MNNKIDTHNANSFSFEARVTGITYDIVHV